MPCEIQIEGLQAYPPYTGLNEPILVAVTGRSSADCTSVRVIVKVSPIAFPALVDEVVVVVDAQVPAGDPLPNLFRKQFALPSLGLRCGDSLFVEVRCTQEANCMASGMFPIICKPPPPGSGGSDHGDGGNGNGGNGNGDNGNGNDGDPWPWDRCLFTAIGAAMALLGALAAFALGAGTQNTVAWAAGVAALALFGLEWGLWVWWCAPDICRRLRVLCWVFKRAFIASWIVLPFATSANIALIIIGYGTVAGWLVLRLRALRCPVPSSKQSITQVV